MGFLFGEFIYRPLYNLLILAYNVLPYHDFGLAIILVTILLKFLLVPLSKKQIQAQKKMQELQPKIKEIQEKYKKDKEKQSRALMDFYKENKANPFSGCLPTVFQLVFLIAIYRVLFDISKAGLVINGKELYSFVANLGHVGQINQYFLGIIDLSKKLDLGHLTIVAVPQLILVVAAAATQYFQIKMLMPAMAPASKNSSNADVSQIMSKQMLYLGPLMTLFIGIQFPAGLALYWLVSTAFTIVQQRMLMKEKTVAAKVK